MFGLAAVVDFVGVSVGDIVGLVVGDAVGLSVSDASIGQELDVNGVDGDDGPRGIQR